MAKEPAAVSPSDEVLLKKIQEEGDGKAQDILLARYKDLVKKKTSLYYMAGAERDDIVQEGMIGLFKAIRDYRFDQKASFKVFAELCINRQIISAIKGANRQKHRPLNSYVSLDKPFYDDGKERTLMDMLGGSRSVEIGRAHV